MSEPKGSIAAVVQSTATATRVQWGAIAVLASTALSAFAWGLTKVDSTNTAMAQANAKVESNSRRLDSQERRIDTVDSGTRSDIQRLEKKIDSNNETTQRALESQNQKLDLLLREVRKR